MGFLDNVASAVNRGTASVQRTGKSAQLKMQLNDLMKQRRDLAAQLGASLYDTAKEMPEMREGREPLFEGIAKIDERRAAIEDQIAQIEAEAAAQQVASAAYKCPKCGTSVAGDDLFCSGCGTPIAEIKAAASAPAPAVSATPEGPVCASCGAPLGEGDLFCMSCGAKAEPAVPAVPEAEAVSELASDPEGSPAAADDVDAGGDAEAVDKHAAASEPDPAEGESARADEGRIDKPDAAAEPEPVAVAAEPAPEPGPDAAAEPEQLAEAPATGFCAHCGNQVSSDDSFCATCGTPVRL